MRWLSSLPESLARGYAAKLADQETRSERKLEEMTTQVVLSLGQHTPSARILLQKASFHRKAYEANHSTR